jgi:F-type H+-transporting ATPase subunit epsilon
MALYLEIVTPEKKIFSDAVDYVYLPSTEGEIGILESHIPLVTALKPGEMRYSKDGRVTHLAVGTGFVEVTGHKVNVLTDLATGEDAIDEARVEEALKRAEDAIANLGHDGDLEEMAHLQANIAKAMAQLRLKRRHHPRV